jgi:hypothetical protein
MVINQKFLLGKELLLLWRTFHEAGKVEFSLNKGSTQHISLCAGGGLYLIAPILKILANSSLDLVLRFSVGWKRESPANAGGGLNFPNNELT